MELTAAAALILFPATLALVCEPCVQSHCSPPTNCLAGLVRDSCNCCYECGRREGEICEHPSVASDGVWNGRCGTGLDCRLRVDLPPTDPPEASCVCRQTSKICGSDGVTYENQCQLTEERYRRRNGLVALSRGPCRFASKIITKPENIQNRTGGNVAFFCEATGWPLPSIQWKKQNENNLLELPGNKTHITVQSRNDDYEVSSWLQFVRVRNDDVGVYWCQSRNDLGYDEASAQLALLSGIRTRS